MATSMVPSCSRGGLEWIWARGTGSRRAGPVRPLSSSGVSTDMTTGTRLQNRSPRSGSQNGGPGRKFRNWCGLEKAARKSLGNDARRHHTPCQFLALSSKQPTHAILPPTGGARRGALFGYSPPSKQPFLMSDIEDHPITEAMSLGGTLHSSPHSFS